MVRYLAILPSSPSRRSLAAWIAACAATSARSATACASSSTRSSGASASRAASVAVTAWSFSCNTNNASRSGCSSPPPSDLVTGVTLAELVEHATLLRQQGHLTLGTLERELLVELRQVALEPAGLDPVHGQFVHLVGVARAEPLAPELLVGPRRRGGQREHHVVGPRPPHRPG